MPPKSKIAHPSGHQTAAKLSWHVGFYRCFFPNCAQVLKLLTDLLRGGGPKRWSGPLPPKRLSKMLNTSYRRRCPSNILPQMLSFLWPLMQHKSGDHWQPLGFFSRKLRDTESHFSNFQCKLLAAQAAIKHFSHFCEDQAFSQTTCYCPFLCFSPHFTQTTTPFGIHLRI
jgi:hypothetical protein